MAIDAALYAQGKSRGAAVSSEALAALACAAFLLTLHFVRAFSTLDTSGGDNDSLLRLVQIRDLIGGQGWFDLHQYRMGPEGGFVMHWSRFVDAPIATIILAVAAITGSMASGETIALIAWPLMLLAAAMFFLIRIGKAVGGDWAMLPVVIIGAAALYFIGIFSPGSVDHHNVQLVLTLAAMAALCAPQAGFRQGIAAGLCAALMLAVGMETLPYVAVAGLYVAVRFLAGGRTHATLATGFGAGFAVAAAVGFVATVPPSAWLASTCDAYSIPQFAIAALAGTGLAAAAGIEPLRRHFATRLLALAGLGISAATTAVLLFPECLAAPYSTLDPRMKTFLLSVITEAQPIWSMLRHKPAMAASYYATPLLALFLLVWRMRRDGLQQPAVVVLAFLAAAIAVSIWQVRGATFAVPLATIPLAGWVGEWRARVAAVGGQSAALKMVLAWLVSLNVAWSASAAAIAGAFQAPLSPGAADVADADDDCYRNSDFTALAALPATTVLAISNLGAPILNHTHHRALSGPYHRNGAGYILMLRALMGSEAEAAAIVNGNNVGLVVLCRGNGETGMLAKKAPTGFIAALAAGVVPAWLERVPGAVREPLEIYRVRKQS